MRAVAPDLHQMLQPFLFLGRKIARPIERQWRARSSSTAERAGGATSLRISDLNRALVPLALSLLIVAIFGFLTIAIYFFEPKSKEEPGLDGWFLLGLAGMAGLAVWLAIEAFRRTLSIDLLADGIVVRKLRGETIHGPDQVQRWGYELEEGRFSPLPPLQDRQDDTRFKLVLTSGYSFDAPVSTSRAQAIEEAMERLVRARPAWAGSAQAEYAANPVLLTDRAALVVGAMKRRFKLPQNAVLVVGVQHGGGQTSAGGGETVDGAHLYTADLVADPPAGAIFAESHGIGIAALPENAPLLAGVTVDFVRGGGQAGFIFTR